MPAALPRIDARFVLELPLGRMLSSCKLKDLQAVYYASAYLNTRPRNHSDYSGGRGKDEVGLRTGEENRVHASWLFLPLMELIAGVASLTH